MRSFSFFVSHSVRAEDLPRLTEIERRASSLGLGLSPRVPTRDLYPATRLPLTVREDLLHASLVLALVEEDGRTPGWVETEIRFACARGRRVLVLAEGGAELPSTLDRLARVVFRRGDSRASFASAAGTASRLRSDAEFSVIAVGLLLQALDSKRS